MAKKTKSHEMPFLDHLEELRWRIIRGLAALVVGMIICFVFSDVILEFLKIPSKRIDPPLSLQFLKVQAIFLVKLEIGFFGGILLVLPYLLGQIYLFVSPALTKDEKKPLIPSIIFATMLFLAGVSFAYLVILPFALDFFVGLATDDIRADISIEEYIGFVIRLCFLFGLVFELPVAAFLLGKIGLINSDLMRRFRRHSIVLIFILAALFTPPDPFTQILLGIPLILLYEFSIFLVKLTERKSSRELAMEAQNADNYPVEE